MTGSGYKLIVGVFALVCLVLLGLLVIMFGGSQSMFTQTYDLNVKFTHGVVGVQIGQSVTLNGKRVGQTTDVDFWDPKDVESGIRVVVAVDSMYPIPQGARVNVGTSIMGFGKPAIMIDVKGLGDAPLLPTDGTAVIEGTMIAVLDQMLPPEMQDTLIGSFEGIKSLSEALRPVAANLDSILQQRDMDTVDAEKAVANISTLVQRFDLVLKNTNVLLADPENVNNLKTTLANARVMSERGVEMMGKLDAMGDKGTTFVADATELVRELRGSVDKLSAVLNEVNKATSAINDTKGTVGLLLNDNRLYEELILSAKRLTAALEEFRETMDVIKKEGFKVKM